MKNGLWACKLSWSSCMKVPCVNLKRWTNQS
jgi:hypothetical protein